jgi:hypothetical protein
MMVSGLRASARRRRAGWPALLSGGALRPPAPVVPPLRFYADAKRDAPSGEEGPVPYHTRVPDAALAPPRPDPHDVLTRAVERWVQWFEHMARSASRRRLERELDALRAIIARARREGRITPQAGDDLLDAAEARVWAAFAARGPDGKIARRRDGIRLGDEATEALLRDVFGDEPPSTGRG